ncbi:hypothetical protein CAOG_007887 [Capsaspora owczarzaki ATCC 30864]|uniref:Gem-associated protein 2 n=1 Tax=Capsaspora owczarzaki (strain ATCC 30864) TaxID=595528 RepID=A0A0D2WY48_CAPO3|nr:hypothetical protein CAOG_007887 [Capsaspora owczarzaki ATCC 30864]
MDESASSQSRVEIDSDDSDSEADELMPRAFQIEQDLTDDLSQPPTTGEQFLRRVQHEARRTRSVVIARTVKPETTAAPQHCDRDASFNHETRANTGAESSKASCATWQPPSEIWQLNVLRMFACARRELNLLRAERLNGGAALSSTFALPSLTNDEAWRKLCLGDDELSSRDTATYPSYELLCSWDQKTICTVLAKMGRWNMAHKPHSVIVRRLQWCFSLLVCLDRLFTMETAFILRELLRSMLRERRKLPNETLDNSEHLAGADLIITLIAHYFDQSDVLRET